MFETAKQAALSPAKEERALLPGSEGKPADIYIPGWVSGRDAALDVTVVSTFYLTYSTVFSIIFLSEN